MNDRNIIYINGRFLTQDITGVQRYAIEVVKQLDKINSNYTFIILMPKADKINKLKLKNIKLIQFGILKGHLWEQISLPIYLLKQNKKAKLINLCNLAPILKPGYVVLHDVSYKTHAEYFSKKFSVWYRLINRLNINRYKHIYTVSEFSKSEIIKHYNINSNKITVTYCSAEHFKNIETDESIVEKLGLRDKKFYFSLGSKSVHKNHKYIFECAENNPNSLFVVSGKENSRVFKDGYNKEKIRNIIYTGYLKDSQLKALYKNCKVFIFPSLYEGFGIPPLEALVSGCNNILLSDIPVLREIYKDNASYIELDNKDCYNIVHKIKTNKKVDTEILLDKYSWKKVAKRIIDNLI